MGGSSSGSSSGYSMGMTRQQKEAIANQTATLNQQKQYLNQMAGYGAQIGALAGSAGVQALAGTGLTGAEQQQLNAVDVGSQRAEQTVQQTAREQSSARGLYSSRGAIGAEAAGLANLDIQKAQNIANIYGQAQQRQFQGLGLQSGLLGNAGSMYGNVAGGYGNIASQYGNIGGAYAQQQQMSNQAQQMQNQYNQQQQNQLYGNIRAGVGLIAAPFTGGMSLGLL